MDNFEVQSTASSDISDSVREQILGKGYTRRKRRSPPGPTNVPVQPESLSYHTASSFENVPSKDKESSFEVVPSRGTEASFQIVPSKDRESSFKVVSSKGTEKSFEVVPSKGTEKSFEVVPSKDTEKSFEVVPSKGTEKSFEVVPSKGTEKSFEIVPSKEKELSFELIPDKESSFVSGQIISGGKENSVSELSMKKSEEKNYSTIQTQTVGIQTVSTCTDCNCAWEKCTCRKCPSKCPHCAASKSASIPEETSESTFANLTESSTLSSYRCTCNCGRNWYDCDTVSTTDHVSDHSDDSYTTDFFDLPYQNNEEYLKLLRELEKKLIARNRERVRRTMQAFERRSRQNRNLDKPVCDYSDDNDSLILNKLTPNKGRKKSPLCCKCGRSKRRGNPIPVNSDIMQNEKRWDEMNFGKVADKSEPHPSQTPSSRVERSMRKSHWQLDPRSGEWIKVSCFQQTDYARHPPPPPPHGDFIKEDFKKPPPVPPPPGNMRRECCCRQKKRR